MNSKLKERNLWYKDAIIYELHVKSFLDSTADGIGDFQGLIRKLDYIKDLGITAIWLLPFYPSPLRDDGYDIADYTNVHPDYGAIADFRELLREAHRRDLRVITELVLNHTSDQHPWFQRARKSPPGSKWRSFYIWSDSPDKFSEARIIFKDFETSNWAWDPVAKAYFWHRFYSHQPDLNYNNPQVQNAILKIIDFWLRMGVDGMRLDAVPYLYEREGTSCENLPETHSFLKKVRAHIDERYPGRMLIAEANQWPEDAVSYFGNDDECHMAYHFPLMPRMFIALQKEDRFPILDIFEQTPSIPEGCQWALFLRNHDELTLEMVTDEERDYMYRAFAADRRSRINLGIRRRLAPLLENNRRKIELMNVILLSLPGTPVIYYGDEIGMGDNYYLGDRNGVRTPMQWSPDLNGGFSSANPQRLFLPVIIDPEYHYAALNVANQERNSSSLLWWMRRMLSLRKRYRAFSRGSIEFPPLRNSRVIAIVRRFKDEIVLVVINLSRFSQVADIDMAAYSGYGVEDLFSGNRLPSIREAPYQLIMAPHSFHWLNVRKESPVSVCVETESRPEIHLKPENHDIFTQDLREHLEHKALPDYFQRCFRAGRLGRPLGKVEIIDEVFISKGRLPMLFLILHWYDEEGSPEHLSLPLRYVLRGDAGGPRAGTSRGQAPGENACPGEIDYREAIVTTIHKGGESGDLIDGVYDKEYRDMIYQMMARRRKLRGKKGKIHTIPGAHCRILSEDALSSPSSTVMGDDSRSAQILFENMFLLKLYRQLDLSPNPELEMVLQMTEKRSFPYIMPFGCALEYRSDHFEGATLAILEGCHPYEDSGWGFFLENAGHYLEEALIKKGDFKISLPGSLLEIDISKLAPPFIDMTGGLLLDMAGRLGRRTGELHTVLASDLEDHRFSPEPFTPLYQRSVFQSLRSRTRQVIDQLSRNLEMLPEEARITGEMIVRSEEDIIRRYKRFLDHRLSALKIRIHDDYNLNNVLFTGKDFIIMNFEGSPGHTQSEARLKRSAMRDICSMIRSFHYAAYSLLLTEKRFRQEDIHHLLPWAGLLYRVLSSIFLGAYLETVRDAAFVPQQREELEIMLDTFLLEKAIEEIEEELAAHPGWIVIPGRAIQEILGRV